MPKNYAASYDESEYVGYISECFDEENALVSSVITMSEIILRKKLDEDPDIYAKARFFSKLTYVSNGKNRRPEALRAAAKKMDFSLFAGASAEKCIKKREDFADYPLSHKRKKFLESTEKLFESEDGHRFFNKFNRELFDFFDAKYEYSQNPIVPICDKYLKEKGFEGEYPFYRRQVRGFGEFVNLPPQSDNSISVYFGYAKLTDKDGEKSFMGVKYEDLTADDCEWNAGVFHDSQRIYIYDIASAEEAEKKLSDALPLFEGSITQISGVDKALISGFSSKGVLSPMTFGFVSLAFGLIPLYYLGVYLYSEISGDNKGFSPEFSVWWLLAAAALILACASVIEGFLFRRKNKRKLGQKKSDGDKSDG